MVLFTAALTMFRLLLRVGEVLVSPPGVLRASCPLCGKAVRPFQEGELAASFVGADEVVITIVGSKTDQQRHGLTRNAFAVQSSLCLVWHMRKLQQAFPRRWKEDAALPLFLDPAGRPILREELQQELRLAAGDLGYPVGETFTHSLRVGGATALYMAGASLDYIKRWGRWSSNSWERYVRHVHARQHGPAEDMVFVTDAVL